jgi:hypothetical protein
MRVGNIPFVVHVHVVERAPFGLLLGRAVSTCLALQDESYVFGLFLYSKVSPSAIPMDDQLDKIFHPELPLN